MAGDIKNPDNEKFNKIKSLKKKGLLNKKGKIIKPIELKEKVLVEFSSIVSSFTCVPISKSASFGVAVGYVLIIAMSLC